MASIFTYEPEPQRVASPWLQESPGHASPEESSKRTSFQVSEGQDSTTHRLSEVTRVTRLQPEPQEGPVEYKLHLLLRARRKFHSSSTANHISGSKHSSNGNDSAQTSRNNIESIIDTSGLSGIETPPASSTQQTRQHRLEQLTTQLLWRLQQSAPHHASSASNIILPSLPEALPELTAPQQPAKLLHGLEETQGALYEIGVSDDGALIGLADDELDESLNNLSAMAACLGCVVEVLRRVEVGRCEWLEETIIREHRQTVRRTGKLQVVEALVKPALRSVQAPAQALLDRKKQQAPASSRGETEQLRITLTGPTMSGKSTLLGTLTTSTLDNGRGSSRLSMLKHRHEISSGVTSSVSQELLGYSDQPGGHVEILNYNTENIASWIDMHDAASGSRLVLIADSAGHPRYRRTTVRGLIGCAPHWTLMCFPADGEGGTATSVNASVSQQHPAPSISDADLSAAQLELCLKLRLPLVIVITKLDLASRLGLRSSLTKVLDALKAAGRKPAIMPNGTSETLDRDLESVSKNTIDGAYDIVLPLLNDPIGNVPIVLTSAVQGTGFSNLHALLHELPLPNSSSGAEQHSTFIFHVEDTFRKPSEVEGIILSGILRHGSVSVGDGGFVGPFAIHDFDDSEDSEDRPPRRSHSLPASRSFPGALRETHLALPHIQLPNQEWRRCRVVSVRNLRLPVHALLQDQAGTLAIVADDSRHKHETSLPLGRIRKGMVFTTIQPIAARSFVAEFRREDLEAMAVGNHVVVYTASVRASAKVMSARSPDTPRQSPTKAAQAISAENLPDLDTLQLSGDERDAPVFAGSITAATLLVSFSLNASKEFLAVGDQVLAMPGGGPGLYVGQERGEKGIAGLDGFVGRITDIFA